MDGDHRMTRRTLLALVAACGVTLTLTGCEGASRFDQVDVWAKKLHLGDVGTAIIRDYHGSNSFEGDAPTLMLLVEGRRATITEPVVRGLQSYGFSKDAEQEYWTSRTESETRVVTFESLEPGGSAFFPEHQKRITVDRESVLVSISVADY